MDVTTLPGFGSQNRSAMGPLDCAGTPTSHGGPAAAANRASWWRAAYCREGSPSLVLIVSGGRHRAAAAAQREFFRAFITREAVT